MLGSFFFAKSFSTLSGSGQELEVVSSLGKVLGTITFINLVLEQAWVVLYFDLLFSLNSNCLSFIVELLLYFYVFGSFRFVVFLVLLLVVIFIGNFIILPWDDLLRSF